MDSKYRTYDAAVIKPIKEIEFDILSNHEIRAMSSLADTHGVEFPDLYDKQEPKRGGLIDQRMGGQGNNICATCQLDGKYCDGHPAHIDLAEPVFNILYYQYLTSIIECFCLGCSHLLVSKETDKLKQALAIKSKRNRFLRIYELVSKTKFCNNDNCGLRVSKIRVDIKKATSAITVYAETETLDADDKGGADKKKQRIILTPEIISEMLDNISDEDCRIIGMDPSRSRPSDMIHKIFHVPPVHVRPSLRNTGGLSVEDCLTHKLADIIKANTRINKQKETNNENSNKYSKDHAHLLQYHCATYYDPNIISVPKADGKGTQFKPLVDRYKGKPGRIRGNIQGKRGNFNARTVITPDQTIASNQIGVPIKIAMNVTFPEFVTEYNYDRLTQLVRNGPDKYPGANFVYKTSNMQTTNKQLYLKPIKETVVLQYGDIVERHLQDGDVVLVNRQPTLHKQSMMGHRIVVIHDESLLTFRLSLSVTTPYAADFDGDEMNIHIPQSIQTQIELEEITDVKKQIIMPAKSVTIYGLVQDGLLGTYNLTDDRTKINWRDAMNIMSYTTFDDFSKFEKNKEYTGSELFSMIVPPRVTMRIGEVDIKNGDLVRGRVNNSVIGAKKKNNLLHYIWDEYGEDATINFIDNCQKLSDNFNLWNGFTVSAKDSQVPLKTKIEIEKYIEDVINKVNIDITNIENNPGYMNVENFESKIREDINVVRDDVSKIALGSVGKDNNFNVMMTSGSKGGLNNLGQMIGCVGFQDFEGGLMPKMYNDRTLCYFHEHDDRAKSRGLCYNSFMDGLSYSEFCYHTKACRAALITTVVKTSDAGYANRKLGKTMEDVMIKYDGTARIANNQIIQLNYGGNSNDTTMQYEYKIGMVEMNNETLENNFKFTDSELKDYSNFSSQDNDQMYATIKNLRDSLRHNAVRSKLNYMTIGNSYMLPVNIARIISSLSSSNSNSKSKPKSNKKVSPKYIIDSIENLLSINETPLVKVPRSMCQNMPRLAIEDDSVSKSVFRVALYDALSPKIVNEKHKISKEIFDSIIDEIKTCFNDNIVEPGEMVGIIAAGALGEAVTQTTISTFHHSGIASLTHSTVGVPRINELIGATKNPKTPQMFIYLNKSSRNSRDIAHRIASYLEKTTFGNVYKKIDVYYDPNPSATGGFMEEDGMTEPFYSRKLTRNSCQTSIDNLPWLFKVQIDKEKMLEKNVTLMDIKSKFCMWWDRRHVNTKKKKEKSSLLKKLTSFAMLSNSDNDTQPIIHIRFNAKDQDKNDLKNKTKSSSKFDRRTLVDFVELIEKFKLKGIDSINRINAVSKERYIDAADGNSMKIGEEYVIYTAGVNLNDIRYITGIDLYRTYSNDIIETLKTFGIEFARNRILTEFLKAYENAGNTGINPQHISILVDIMCYGGTVISADRHGMMKANIDPLTKASFEKSIDVLTSAAVFGDIDRMQGVSSRIYIGSVFKGGTGYCELVLDTQMIQNSEYVEKTEMSESGYVGAADKGLGTSNNIAINTIANAIINGKVDDEIFIP
ncbi:uncharacterized protein LOC136072252 [Hydra vulgaris]|uniref:uncharacterized protein LOC136072252 n=1 Tax=Hydra vulgaris TaxID=6087 RepID=UPI0032E9CE61